MRFKLFIISVILFGGNALVCYANEGVEERLFRILNIINSDNDKFDCIKLSELSGIEIPKEVCKILIKAEEINLFSDSIFLGYEAVAYKELMNFYTLNDHKKGVLQYLNVNDYLELPLDDKFYFVENINGVLEEQVDVDNIRDMIPLFHLDGEIMFYSINSADGLKGIVNVVDGQASIVAPSIVEHVEDLLGGVREGVYLLDGEHIVFPSSWHNRKKLREGLIKINQYGEIIDDLNNQQEVDNKVVDSGDTDPGFLKKWLDQWK